MDPVGPQHVVWACPRRPCRGAGRRAGRRIPSCHHHYRRQQPGSRFVGRFLSRQLTLRRWSRQTTSWVGRGVVINQSGVPTILHEQVGDGWPLIRTLLSDEVYAARYRELLEHALDGLYAPEAIEKRARQLHALIAPFVVGDQGERTTHTTVSSKAAFEEALDGPGGLLERIRRRHDAVRDALAQAKAR